MGKDVTDGKYVGELTPEEIIEQYEYRISIHDSYAGLVEDDPGTWLAFGSYEYHMWAINGYEWGIKYIKGNNSVVYKNNIGETLAIIAKAITKIFKGGNMSSKLTSRKFWVSVVTEIVGLVTLFAGAANGEQVQIIAGAVIMVAVALGYLKAEKDVDVARAVEKKK